MSRAVPRASAAARRARGAAWLGLAIALALAGCKKQAEPPPPSDIPVMPASEVRRGQDACTAYVERVCACASTVPSMQQPCSLARALPDAMQVSLDVSIHPDSARRDVLQAHHTVRKIVKECIEETAKLPAAGCP
jgi:hypothetical protein